MTDEEARADAERGRVEAEDEREAHEVRRRISEGGADQHVPGNEETGRVEAEEARGKAEHRRAVLARTSYLRIATLVALPVALIALIPSVGGVVWLKRDVDRRCVDSAVNRDAIRLTVLDGLPTLGYRYDADTNKIVLSGKPPIDYYVTHEQERDDAVARARVQLDRFPPIDC